MKSLLSLAAALAIASAKPELYKENEDFQYSRSSTDEGAKAGFYGAQRGNMGGNYERAHNMDGLAQHQMSSAVRQVEGEIGDGFKTKTGSVFTASDSRGMYGSGKYDLSNLKGRNFQEGLNYGDSQSHSSLSSHNSNYNSQSSLQSSAYQNAQNSRSYTGYQGAKNYRQGVYSGNLQTAENVHDTGSQDFGTQAAGHHSSGHYTQSGYNSESGYNSHSAYNSQSALDSSNGSGRSASYGIVPHNRLVYATPVKVVGRPGSRVAVPVGVQTYAVHSGYDHNAQIVNSDALTEVLSNSDQHVNYKPTSEAKQYESSYSYRKQWEKHNVKPEIIEVPTPTDTPVPKNSELYDDTQTLQASNNDYNAIGAHTSQASGFSQGYNSHAQLSSASQSRQHSDLQYQHENVGSNLNTYGNTHSASNLDRSADALGNSDPKPKSYHSSYSYHKSWERQGDPYEILPSTSANTRQATQRLTAASNTKGYSANQYASQQQQHSHQGYAHTADCDENGHIRVARSPQSQYESYKPNDGYQSFDEMGQEMRNRWSNLRNLSGKSTVKLTKMGEEPGQQQENNWDDMDDMGQQNQKNWDQLEDQQQSIRKKWENYEEMGQQTEYKWDKTDDVSQQKQDKWNKDVKQFGDPQQPSENKWDNLGQQAQSGWDRLEDLGQPSQNPQTQNKWNKAEDVSQQPQNKWDRTEDPRQQIQKNWDKFEEIQNRWDKLDNSKPHTQSIWDKAEELGHQENKWNKMDEDFYQQTRHKLIKSEDGKPPSRNIWNKIEDLGDDQPQVQNIWNPDSPGKSQPGQSKYDEFGQDQTNFVESYIPAEAEFGRRNIVTDKTVEEAKVDAAKQDIQSNQTHSPWVGSVDFRKQLRNPWDAWRARQQQTVITKQDNAHVLQDNQIPTNKKFNQNELGEKLFPQNTRVNQDSSEKFEQNYLATQDQIEEGNPQINNVWGSLDIADKQDKQRYPASIQSDPFFRKQAEISPKIYLRSRTDQKKTEYRPSWESVVEQTAAPEIFATKSTYVLKYSPPQLQKTKNNKIFDSAYHKHLQSYKDKEETKETVDTEWFNNKVDSQNKFAKEWNKLTEYEGAAPNPTEEKNNQEYSHGYLGLGTAHDNSWDEQSYHAERASYPTKVNHSHGHLTNTANISSTFEKNETENFGFANHDDEENLAGKFGKDPEHLDKLDKVLGNEEISESEDKFVNSWNQQTHHKGFTSIHSNRSSKGNFKNITSKLDTFAKNDDGNFGFTNIDNGENDENLSGTAVNDPKKLKELKKVTGVSHKKEQSEPEIKEVNDNNWVQLTHDKEFASPHSNKIVEGYLEHDYKDETEIMYNQEQMEKFHKVLSKNRKKIKSQQEENIDSLPRKNKTKVISIFAKDISQVARKKITAVINSTPFPFFNSDTNISSRFHKLLKKPENRSEELETTSPVYLMDLDSDVGKFLTQEDDAENDVENKTVKVSEKIKNVNDTRINKVKIGKGKMHEPEAERIWQVLSDAELVKKRIEDGEMGEQQTEQTVWGQSFKDFKKLPNFKLPLAEDFGLKHPYHEFQSYKLDAPQLAETFKKINTKRKKSKEKFNKKVKVKFQGKKSKITSWFKPQIS